MRTQQLSARVSPAGFGQAKEEDPIAPLGSLRVALSAS